MLYLNVSKYVAKNSPLKRLLSTSNCQCSLFSKKNPIIRIFCISGCVAVTINPGKWSSTVLSEINTSITTHKPGIRGRARAPFASSLDPPLKGMSIGFVKASKCQLECLLDVLTNQNASWNAERFSPRGCYRSAVQDCHKGRVRRLLRTHTHTRAHTRCAGTALCV
jgi:hypothetical protein